MIEIGDKIKKLRLYNNMTVDELIKRMITINPESAINKSNISRWENNKEYPKIENLALVAQALQVTSDFLLGINIGHNIDIFNILDTYKGQILEEVKNSDQLSYIQVDKSDVKNLTYDELLVLRKKSLTDLKRITTLIIECEDYIEKKAIKF